VQLDVVAKKKGRSVQGLRTAEVLAARKRHIQLFGTWQILPRDFAIVAS
jgi:hypothetical protein